MTKRKILIVAFTLLLTVSLITGCSQAELGFLKLQNEISEVTLYEASGKGVFSLKGLPTPETSDPIEIFIFTLLENGINLSYTSKVDQEKDYADVTLAYINKLTGAEQELIQVLCQGNTLYLKVDQLSTFFQVVGDTETSKKLDELFNNIEYLSLTTDDYFASLGVSAQDLPITMFNGNSFMNTALNKLMLKFMSGMPDAYANYSSGLVQQKGNTYTWEMNGIEAIEFLGSFLEYTLNNMPEVETWVVSLINNLSEAEMYILGLDPQKIAEYKMLLSMITAEVTTNKEEYLEMIKGLSAELDEEEEVQEVLKGVNYGYSLAKNGANTYTSTAEFNMDFSNTDPQFNIQMVADTQINALTTPFTVEIPTTGIMTYSEFLQKTTKTIHILVDSNTYFLGGSRGGTQTPLEVKNIDNQTYLPMPQIAQIFGEEVGWDADNSQAYVLRNDIKIDMTGVVINERTYIKTRDFTKLGYDVDWDDVARTVTIVKDTL